MNFTFLDIGVTHRCNFMCRHCIVPEFKGDFPYDKIVKLWGEIEKLNCLRVSLTGGEPFLRKDLVKIAAGAREKQFAVHIFSNGSCIKKKL